MVGIASSWREKGGLQNIQESDPEVRDAAAAALGSAMKAVGEKPMLPLLTVIQEDSAKMAKVRNTD